MKIVLINPGRTIAGNNIWRLIHSVTPPIGLALLAAVLERDGHRVRIVDAAALRLTIPAIVDAIEPGTDWVGLTATTPEIDRSASIAGAIRRSFPGLTIAMGGVHPTIYHVQLVADGVCDLVFRGEAEEAVLEFSRGRPLAQIPNLTWKAAGGDVRVNRESPVHVSLDELPHPAYHLLPMHRYRSALGGARAHPSIGMMTSRGCPGRCTFCYSGMFGSKLRLMSPERIVEEIAHLRARYGIREVSFYDDTFTVNRERVAELCALLLVRKLGVSWSCFARVDSVTPEILRVMKRAGCHQVCYGVESSDGEILRALRKRTQVAAGLRAMGWTRQAGIDVRASFMLGSPGETPETIGRTLEFSRRVGVDYAVYNVTTPFPGTELYAWAEERGLLLHTNWSAYDLATPILRLPTVSPEFVRASYVRAYRDFYLRPRYMLSRLRLVRSPFELRCCVEALFRIITMIARGASDVPR